MRGAHATRLSSVSMQYVEYCTRVRIIAGSGWCVRHAGGGLAGVEGWARPTWANSRSVPSERSRKSQEIETKSAVSRGGPRRERNIIYGPVVDTSARVSPCR